MKSDRFLSESLTEFDVMPMIAVRFSVSTRMTFRNLETL